MTSRKKDNRTLKRKPASVASTTVDEHDEPDDPILKKVLKKADRAALVVSRLQDTSSTTKVSSAGGATPSKSSGRSGSGSSSSKRRRKKEPTPEPSSSSSSEDEEEDEDKEENEDEDEDEDEEDEDQKEEQENGSDNEQEEEEALSCSSSSEDEEEKRREEERLRKEKQKKRKSARDKTKQHKSSSGKEERHVKQREKSKDKDKSDKRSSSSSDGTKRHPSSSNSSTRTRPHISSIGSSSSSSSKPAVSSKSTSNKPSKKPQVTADALIAISEQQQQQQQQHCDSFNIGDLEHEVLDYEESEDVHTQTPSPVSREPGSPVPKHVDDTGMEIDDDQPTVEQNGDDAADDAADGVGAGNDAEENNDDGNESDGTVCLDENPCEKKTSDKNKLPLKRQDGITMMSPLHTRSGKSIGGTSTLVPPAVVAAEKDDTKQQEVVVVVVTADVHRSGSVSPRQQREKSSKSSPRVVEEETGYEKYSKETYSNNWERWCYARLPGGKAMLYDVDGTQLHGKIPSVLDMHVIDTDSSVAHKLKDYKQNFYNASKQWVKLLMTSLRELSECDLDINYHQLFSITDVSNPRHVFYGRAMGSDETVFSIIEDVFNDIGVNEKIHADVSLHEFPQCVDLVHFEQDRSADEKTDNRIKKFADDNNSDSLIAGILGHLCQSINVDTQITKKQYESTISYCDGLFVLPVKYQGYMFPGVDMYGYSDPLSRMSASFDLDECNPIAIDVLILLESLLMVHNCLYPIMNYDEKWIQLTTHCYNDLQQEQPVRAPSSIDYQCRMMNLLDEVIEFEHSLTKDNGSSRQDRRVKQAFNLLVDLYCMNRIMTLSYSHEARCVRDENLLTQDRDMVVYNILVKFLAFEERAKEVSVKDSGFQSLLLQWSGSGGAYGDSKAARGGGKQQTVQQLRLKLPSYFTDVILKHFMSQ